VVSVFLKLSDFIKKIDQHSKNAIRSEIQAQLDRLSAKKYEELSLRICDRLMTLPIVQASETIHVYWPVTSSRETDIRPAISALIDAGKRIVLPVVESFSREPTEHPRLRHETFTDSHQLVANRWGILEPVGGQPVDANEIDLVITPAKAIDPFGTRLGHGFGYYDEFLKPLNAITVCPIFDFARVKHIPKEPHDVQIAYTVTEHAIWKNSGT